MKCCDKEVQFGKSNAGICQGHCTVCGTYYQIKIGSKVAYKTTDNGENWWCNECGSEIRCVEQTRPIHDGPFPLSGSGRVHIEQVPYCPKCETIPETRGVPITPRS